MKIGFDHLVQGQRYREYKRRLDPRAVLEHYGAENCREQTNADGSTEIIHSCLLDQVEPHHNHGDANPSAACNVDKKLYICYQWWGGDLMHFIAKMERKESMGDILPVVSAFLAGDTGDADTFLAELAQMFAQPGLYTVDLPSYSDRVLNGWTMDHPYWASRGIAPETIVDLRLGYDPHERRVVFPHFVEGKLVGWQKRITPETDPPWPKYRNSLGFPKAETLYRLDEARAHREVVVVESPMSVARAHSLGMPWVVATFGAKVTARQVELLRDFDQVYVWFDADDAGRAGERKLVAALDPFTDVRVVTPDPGHDLGDCATQVEVLEKLRGAVPAPLRLGDYRREAAWTSKRR